MTPVSHIATYLAMDRQAGDAPPFRKFARMPTTLQTNQEANSQRNCQTHGFRENAVEVKSAPFR